MHRIDLIEQLAHERQQQFLAEAAQRRQLAQLRHMGQAAPQPERATWAQALQRALEDVWAIGLRNKPQF